MTADSESSSLIGQESTTNHIPQAQSKHEVRKRSSWANSWTMECVGMCISIAALSSIATLLYIYNGRPLSTWPHFISLNTALSTLVIVMKSSMMIPIGSCLGQLKWLWYSRKKETLLDFQVFDAASRGPWGSFRLLLRLRSRHLASIGAAVTVLALASGSFVQQAVSYPQWNVPQPHLTASVPYAQNYTYYLNDTHFGQQYVGEPMMAAIYDGIFSQNLTHTSSSLQATCPSGDCAFPPYASLGVCSRCADVTPLLKYHMTPNVHLGASYYWSLPNGLQLSNIETGISYINISSSSSSPGTSYSPETALNSDALSAYQTQGTLLNISIITGPGNGKAASSAEARDCVLFFCARTYTSHYLSNVFHEQIYSTFEKPAWKWPEGTFGYDDPPATFEVPSESLPGNLNQDHTFSVDRIAFYVLQEALGSIWGVGGVSSAGTEVFTTDVALGFYYHGITGNDVSRTVDNIASALTNAVRQIPQSAKKGTTYALQTHIVVQWLWLVQPLVMVLLALVFFALTILQTSRSGVPKWQTSAIAIMEHGISTTMIHSDPDVEKRALAGAGDGEETVSQLESWARNINVKLQRRGENASGFGLSLA